MERLQTIVDFMAWVPNKVEYWGIFAVQFAVYMLVVAALWLTIGNREN